MNVKKFIIDPIHKNLIYQAIQSNIDSVRSFMAFKKKFCASNKVPEPTNANIRGLYEKMIQEKEIKRNPLLERAMLARSIRTQSGVAVIAVLTKPYACPGTCVFCPTEKDMPKSYLSNEPAVMRAIMNKFNPFRQVQNRLRSLELNGHNTDKIELIVMGGTFSYFPKKYQRWFVKECFRSCNSYGATRTKSKAYTVKREKNYLAYEQKKNETAKHRIIGLTLETRPDYINEDEIINFRKLGCTRVELGVQSVYDDVLIKNKRGHLIKETIYATKLLKQAGFKINYHMMPGLLGSALKKDYAMFQKLFSESCFQPDMLKIYPTVVIKDAELYTAWKQGKYKALTDKQFENLAVKLKNEVIPPYVRIARLVRDVPVPSIEAGPKISNLRQIIAKRSNCQCIRCREVRGNYSDKEKIILDRIDYTASDGKEIFLQFVSPDKQKLFALLRLRIPTTNTLPKKIIKAFPVLKDTALIREVHTYGKLASISQKETSSPQHIGLGRKLVQEAERIAKKECGFSRIAIISGIGVREYYRKLGYRLQDTYMVKKCTNLTS